MTSDPADRTTHPGNLDSRFASLELNIVRSRAVVHLTDGPTTWMPPGSAATLDEAAAADTITEWARTRKIFLPLSSGHVTETTPLDGDNPQERVCHQREEVIKPRNPHRQIIVVHHIS